MAFRRSSVLSEVLLCRDLAPPAEADLEVDFPEEAESVFWALVWEDSPSELESDESCVMSSRAVRGMTGSPGDGVDADIQVLEDG